MTSPHPEYCEYARCDTCHYVKYVRLENGKLTCYSCDNKNFSSLNSKPTRRRKK